METEYVTDSGLVVPAISFQLRARLQVHNWAGVQIYSVHKRARVHNRAGV